MALVGYLHCVCQVISRVCVHEYVYVHNNPRRWSSLVIVFYLQLHSC